MEKVLVTGSAGFIGGYVVEELLRQGFAVVGVDNYSKYGPVKKSYDDNPNYELVVADVLDTHAHDRAAHGLRPLHRRRGAHRRHLVLPHLPVRPHRRERAHHRLVVRCRDRREEGGRQAEEGHVHVVLDGVRVDRPLALEGGRRAARPAAAVVLRLPEARGRVLRPCGQGPVRRRLHDPPPLQLRRHRRVAGARRRRDPLRQRAARDEPRRARPRAEGLQGSGPAPHPR